MTLISNRLPEYDAPPVSEVALAVDFTPIEGWQGPHAGLYWSLINKRYPHTQVHPMIPSIQETFGEENRPQQAIQFNLMAGDQNRTWFLAEPANYLIQVQRDKFIINWRQVTGDESYPRYAKDIRLRFEQEWKIFRTFIEQNNLGTINVRQGEVFYVNDIIKGKHWDNFGQSLDLFAQCLGKGSDGFLPAPETLGIGGSFIMAEGSGRLHFQTQHLFRQIDQKEVVQLRLMARGKPVSDSDEDLLSWMDTGREWIVRGFTDLTSKKAHDLWKRTR